MIPVLLILIIISAVGIGYVSLRSKEPTSIESGISSFQREMDALAPNQRRRPNHFATPEEPAAPQDVDEG